MSNFVEKKSITDELGYSYSNPRNMIKNPNMSVWRCSKRTQSCKAQITVENGLIVSRRHLHNH